MAGLGDHSASVVFAKDVLVLACSQGGYYADS
jgi:hypothetical protein